LTRTRQHVGVAADHGGFELKEQLVGKLRAAGHGGQTFKVTKGAPQIILALAANAAAVAAEVKQAVRPPRKKNQNNKQIGRRTR
jgi:ribose 5-phosphate isomerase RpiB